MNKTFTTLVSIISVVGTADSLAVNADTTKNENKVDEIRNNIVQKKDEPSKLEKAGTLVGQVFGVVVLGTPAIQIGATAGSIGTIIIGGGSPGLSALAGFALGGIGLYYLTVKGCGALGGYLGRILNDILF